MGAGTTIYVEVSILRNEIREYSAVTLDEAEEIARHDKGVLNIVRSSHERIEVTEGYE